MDSNSLSHTKWNCKYHIVFAPKYRRKVAYGKIKQDIANILSMLCKRKGVKIVEADQKPEIIKEDEYCNIVAKKAGIIEKISAVNGTPLVQKGDVVKAGTPIIGGWLEGKFTGTRYVHANGSVQAKVWYSENVKIPLNQVVSKETGNEETKYSLRINNFK